MKRVDELVASAGGRIAAGAFQRTVAVWDLRSAERLCEIDTVLDFGGRRLALDPSGEHLVAGAYNAYGVAAYEVPGGRLIWHRKDLKKVQWLRITGDGQRLHCGFDCRSLHVLDLVTGSTLESWRAVRRVYENASSDCRIIEKRKISVVHRELEIGSVERTTFGVLDVALGNDDFCVTECNGPVRSFQTSTTNERWRYQPEKDQAHVVRLGWSPETNIYYGIEYPYRKGGTRTVLRFDGQTGRTEQVCRFNATAHCFAGEHLVAGSGQVFELSTGNEVACLAFTSSIG